MEMPAEFTTGERIRHLRERRGMTRVVLANLVGYSADWLKRIEAGQRGVSIPALVRLAQVLHVDDLSVLIDGEIEIPSARGRGHIIRPGMRLARSRGSARSGLLVMSILPMWQC
jgi:transcriptional regulator with XRE-family HTH domain